MVLLKLFAKLLRDLNDLLMVLNWFYSFSLKIQVNLSCVLPIHVMRYSETSCDTVTMIRFMTANKTFTKVLKLSNDFAKKAHDPRDWHMLAPNRGWWHQNQQSQRSTASSASKSLQRVLDLRSSVEPRWNMCKDNLWGWGRKKTSAKKRVPFWKAFERTFFRFCRHCWLVQLCPNHYPSTSITWERLQLLQEAKATAMFAKHWGVKSCKHIRGGLYLLGRNMKHDGSCISNLEGCCGLKHDTYGPIPLRSFADKTVVRHMFL